jgi:hypothetical protein
MDLLVTPPGLTLILVPRSGHRESAPRLVRMRDRRIVSDSVANATAASAADAEQE